ncbi:unnamed protein product [Toxocara canis]|uniref:Homeobox domain-containing protein n=1 Tax=Toxocara canis TaxID=6265 RepID=A0A183U8F3_TOXCA|nr:unnamed protein product [Toxocara canis]
MSWKAFLVIAFKAANASSPNLSSSFLPSYWASQLTALNAVTSRSSGAKSEVKDELQSKNIGNKPTEVSVEVNREVDGNPDTSKEELDIPVGSAEGAEVESSGHETPKNDAWRPLRSRSFLTDAQVAILLTHFKRNPFPSKYELSAVAEQIGVNKRVVQVWFQNTRAKERRSNRLGMSSDRYTRPGWGLSAARTSTVGDPMQLMAAWAQHCSSVTNSTKVQFSFVKKEIESSFICLNDQQLCCFVNQTKQEYIVLSLLSYRHIT